MLTFTSSDLGWVNEKTSRSSMAKGGWSIKGYLPKSLLGGW